MKTLGTVGRGMYGLVFLVFGIVHFIMGSKMAGYVPGWIPGGTFWVYLVGVALILAGISILINQQVRLACILLGVMLLIFVLTIHLPGALGTDSFTAATMYLTPLLKDFALAGAAWYIAGQHSATTRRETEPEI